MTASMTPKYRGFYKATLVYSSRRAQSTAGASKEALVAGHRDIPKTMANHTDQALNLSFINTPILTF